VCVYKLLLYRRNQKKEERYFSLFGFGWEEGGCDFEGKGLDFIGGSMHGGREMKKESGVRKQGG